MTLSDRASSVLSRLDALVESESKVKEVGALESLRFELERAIEPLLPIESATRVLGTRGIHIEEPKTLSAARQRAERLLGAFQAKRSADTLKSGQTWRRMNEDLTESVDLYKSEAMRAWKESRSGFFGGETPAALKAKLPKTPENDRALVEYAQIHSEYSDLFSRLPDGVEVIDLAKTRAKQLQEISGKFERDVHPEVRAFFAAVQSAEGASLDLLTSMVIKHLANNGSLDDYCVKFAHS